jgi:hypothetical protein
MVENFLELKLRLREPISDLLRLAEISDFFLKTLIGLDSNLASFRLRMFLSLILCERVPYLKNWTVGDSFLV